jgi:hypothetical protein
METAVSAPEQELRRGGGRSNGVRPSLSSASNNQWCCPARPGAEPAAARLLCPDLELRQGLTFHLPSRDPCGDACFHRSAERARKWVRALLDARSDSSASSTVSAVNERNTSQRRQECLVRWPQIFSSVIPSLPDRVDGCLGRWRWHRFASRQSSTPRRRAHRRSGAYSPAIPPPTYGGNDQLFEHS